MSELKEITKASMEQFINANPSFCTAVKATLIEWGNKGDHDAINHFQEFVTIIMSESIDRYRQYRETKRWKNYNT